VQQRILPIYFIVSSVGYFSSLDWQSLICWWPCSLEHRNLRLLWIM